MKHTRIVLTAALFIGASILAHAQEPGDEPKPPKQEEPRQHEEQKVQKPDKQEEPQKAEKQEEAKPQKSEKHQDSKTQEASKPGQEQKGQQTEQGHPGGKSAHIPDQKFKASFGRPHTIVARQVIHTTTVVAGQTQFVYSGYTFVILDPWPTGNRGRKSTRGGSHTVFPVVH